MRIFRSEKGGAEVFVIGGAAAFALFFATYIATSINAADSSLQSETRSDLSRIQDKVALGLASETECRTAFTSSPLNALNFVDGPRGTEAMDLTALPVRGVNLAAVNQPITGGSVTKIWLENEIANPMVGALRHFHVKLKIRGEASTLRFPAVKELKMGVLVDAVNKIQFCYLEDSAAMKACQSIGGIYDPTQTPQCRFTFSGAQCGDPRSCVTGVNAAGQLICSAPIPTPTPEPPSYMCFCIYPPNPTPVNTWNSGPGGCNAAFIAGAGSCWLEEI